MRFTRTVLAGCLLVATAVASAPAGSAPRRPAPSVLGIGLMASTDVRGLGGWMPMSGVPWTYAYRYLGGGALRPSKNWTGWAPKGSYPIRYAETAESHRYVPVFTYYQMLAGPTSCPGCGEARRDLGNLNSPAAMRAYYADFALLMKRLGPGTHDGVKGYGKDVIVHLEPDLSGYAQMAALRPATNCFGFCSKAGNDPSNVRASVRSSGFAGALRYPDTYRGFNQVLLRLRDTYGPNVRLGLHTSNWTTGYDINSSKDGTLDAAALGRRAGAFAAASGARWTDGSHSTYDLVFNDVSNKDAGYYKNVLGKDRFWDQDNRAFPNFHRWEAYLKAVTTTTGRKAFVWQVPIGNQHYRSQNNTAGHYQDNRVEYFFGHMPELRAAGVAAVLFGTTIPQATNYADWAKDGTTNPLRTCSRDGWSSGRTVCSTRVATSPDDDGGFLRLLAGNYYKAPLPLPG
jgi:hypothetical protein